MLPLLAIVIVANLGLLPKPIGPTPAPLTLTARDGVKIYAETYPAFSPTAPVLLLFHQAGSGKGEYAPLAPRLATLGFNSIAIDQRSGGDMYGANQTATELGKTVAMQDALPDLEAALAWARANHPASKIVAVGSSYSAGLVFALAAKHPGDLAGVAAFSPGEYFPDPTYVRAAARKVKVPVFIDSASDREEMAKAKAIFAAVASREKTLYVPKAGVHGASTLRDDRDSTGANENFNAFLAFLRRVTR
jgi:dienelactone hydrolase